MRTSAAAFVLAALASASPLAAAGEAPVVFRFAWPVPSQVRVTETVLKKGRTAVLRYQASLVKAAESRLELRFSGVELVESPAPDVPPVAGPAGGVGLDVLLPTLVISPEGQVEKVIDFDQALDAVLPLLVGQVAKAGMMEGGIDAEAQAAFRSVLRSPLFMTVAKARSAGIWMSWVGAWAGLDLRPGEQLALEVSLPMPDGKSLSSPTRVKNLGSDPAAKGHVCLSRESVIEGREAVAAMLGFMKPLLERLEPPEKQPVTSDDLLGVRYATRLTVSTQPSTLRPRKAVSETTISVTVKGEGSKTQVERHTYEFDWGAPKR